MGSRLPQSRRTRRRWVIQPLLALVAAFLCTVVSPVLAKSPVVNSAVQSLQSSPAETQSLVQQGKTLYEAGQFAEAVKVLQQAADAFKDQGDGLRQAMVLSNLSLAYQQLSLWSEATKAITDSLNLLQTGQTIGNSKDRLQFLAQALNTQGRLQLSIGQAGQALTTWQQAATTYAQAGDDAGITLSLINQAQALQTLGLYRRAKATLKQVNETLQKQPDSLIKSAGLRHFGNVLRVVGDDLDEPRKVLQQSLAIAQQLRSAEGGSAALSPQEVGATLLSLGNLARLQQKAEAALALYQQAATVSPSPTTKLQAQLNQLNLLLETQQASAARALLPQLQSQLANLPPSHTAIYARIDFAQSLTRLKQSASTDTPSWSEIAKLLATAVQQAKSLGDRRAEAYALSSLGGLYEQTQQWSSAQDLTQQALLLTQAINAPDIAYRCQWQLGRLLKVLGDRQGAIAAYTEAVNNLKSLRSDLVAINPDVQFSFREEVEPVYRQLVGLLLESKEGSQPSQENLRQAREVIESLQLAELDNFFRENCLAPLRSVESIDAKAAVIYPILLDDRLEVILSLPGQELRHYASPIPSHQVESLVEELQRNLVLPYTSEKEIKSLSQAVYNWLIQPAETALTQSGVETLVFVLDGPLRNIPMAALYDGEQYLAEKYSIALAPGLQLVDPKPLVQRQLKALTAGLTKSSGNFAPLEFVEQELEQIKSEIPTEELRDREFTRENLNKKLESFPVPVVHIATHGQFSSQASETFIVAWKDEQIKVKQLGDLLRARDQSQPDSLELLVLSACETAAGDKRAALGLAGAAVRAGARSTLASLWLVDDESTALLMSRFYQELKSGVTKAEALRRAQQSLLQGKYQHPRFWAAFVLLGNWL